MNKLIKIALIGGIGNLVLVGKYFMDKTSIRCEPCAPASICPPCETGYMAHIGYYLMAWNIALFIFLLVWMNGKKNAKG